MNVVAEQGTQPIDDPPVVGGSEHRIDAVPATAHVKRPRTSGARVEQLLTVAEAADCVGCCEETIRRAYLARQLSVLRFGARRVRIRPSALVAWLERGGKTTAA
jgi:excisionase family DNA binding protein